MVPIPCFQSVNGMSSMTTLVKLPGLDGRRCRIVFDWEKTIGILQLVDPYAY